MIEKKNINELLGMLKESQDGTLVVELAQNASYSIAYGTLEPKQENKRHRLSSSETYFFLEGAGILIFDDQKMPVQKNMLVTIPENCSQKLVNTSEKKLTFLMIVSPPYNVSHERIEED